MGSDGATGGDFASTLLVAQRGDVNLDGAIDIADFNLLALHFDPLGLNSGNDWSRGNFDGDADVDISDFVQLVRNFSPLGYAIQSAFEAHSALSVISAAVVPAPSPTSGSGDATA